MFYFQKNQFSLASVGNNMARFEKKHNNINTLQYK